MTDDHSEMEVLYLSQVLVESIEVLENRTSAEDFLVRDVISRELKWPAILRKDTARRAIEIVESPGHNIAVRVLGSIEYPNYEDSVFSKYAAYFERAIQSYFEEGCWQVWEGIPGLLDVDEMNKLGCLTDDDMFFISRRLSSNGASSKMSKRGREALHKVAFAIKYLAYMTISPCRMRAWLWQDWVNCRIFHWEKLGQSYKRGPKPVHEGEARYPEKLPLRGNYDPGEEPRFEEECQHYFGGLGELLSVADATIGSLEGRKNLKTVNLKFEECCNRIVNAFLRRKGLEGIDGEFFDRKEVSKVPKPQGGWARFLEGEPL